MATTDFVPFATGGGANVQDQASYAAAGWTATGFVSGIANSAAANKALRQGTFAAATLMNFVIGQTGVSQPDDGNLSFAVTNLTNALTTLMTSVRGFALYAYAGNPNGHVAGVQGNPGVRGPDICEDSTTGHLWVCTVTGNAASATWVLGAAAGVTSITAGTGLTGGVITSTGTVALAVATAFTVGGGTLGGVIPDGTSISVNAQGVISAASTGGNMVGPTSATVVDDFVTWGNTTGTLTKDVAAATASQVWVGTDNKSPATSLTLKNASAIQTLGDAATVNWDMSQGYNARVTLGGNRTLATPTNSIAGRTYMLSIYQPSSGGPCTLTMPGTFDFGGAGTPTLSTAANKIDRLSLYCEDASVPRFAAFFSKGS